MSMKTTTFTGLDHDLEVFFGSQRTEDTCNLLRRAVVVSSNLQNDIFEPNGVIFPARTILEKILLGLYQWYCPREIGCLINLYLEEHWGAEFLELKACLLTSKELALGAILESDQWSDRDFHGNILKEKHWKFFYQSYLRRKPSKGPKRLIRRRGYNDHGSLRLPHESEPSYDSKDFLSVVQLEERRALQRQVISDFRKKVILRLELEGIVA